MSGGVQSNQVNLKPSLLTSSLSDNVFDFGSKQRRDHCPKRTKRLRHCDRSITLIAGSGISKCVSKPLQSGNGWSYCWNEGEWMVKVIRNRYFHSTKLELFIGSYLKYMQYKHLQGPYSCIVGNGRRRVEISIAKDQDPLLLDSG